MKNISLALNVLLVAAVTYLYVLHFSGKHTLNNQELQTRNDSSITTHVRFDPKQIKASKIVFVNAETLYGKYEYVKELRQEAAAKQNQLEGIYKQKGEKLQQDYAELQQKASQGTLSSDQAKVAEADLMKRKAELDGMEKQLGVLAEETQHKNAVLQDKINQYLRVYNKNGHYNYILSYTSLGGSILLGSDSLDITHEILDGLNEQYKSEKGKMK